MKTNLLITLIFLLFFSSIILAITETEPNDDITNAQEIDVNQTILGSVDEFDDDYDFFKVWLNSGDLLLAELNGNPGTDFDLRIELYNYTILNSSLTNSYPETASITATESRYYYIEIFASSGSGNYTLTLSQPTVTTSTTTTTTTTTLTHPADLNHDGIIGDFELLDYIKKWAQGLVEDFKLLEAIKIWAG